MHYHAIIFDLDGVIVSTDLYHYQAWKKIADSLGIYFDEQINHRLRGVSRMESLEIILERYDGVLTLEEKTALSVAKNEHYHSLLVQMTPADISDEVKTTLDCLKESHLKLAIGSSSKNARVILEQVGLSDFFDAISDGNNIINSKPDPEVFVKAAEMLRVDCSRCAVVEDAKAGIIAAKRAGMSAVAIHDAFGMPEADISLTSFSQLPYVFGLQKKCDDSNILVC